jgi:hypothetical protein
VGVRFGRGRRVAFLLMLILMVPAGTVLGEPRPLSAQAEPPAHPSTGVDQAGPAGQPRTDPRIGERLTKQARVAVIAGVTLSRAFTPEDGLDPTSRSAQRAAIRVAQAAVVRAAPMATNVKQFETVPFVALTVDAAALQALQAAPGVSGIYLDTLDSPALFQSVPLVGAPAAWSQGYDGSGWTVAVLDTGVQSGHPFFATLTGTKVVSEACYSTTNPFDGAHSLCPGGVPASTAPGSGEDCAMTLNGCGHGTHVAGIVAGANAIMSGVAKGATLIAVQVFTRFDNPDFCNGQAPCALTYASDQILGLERVLTLHQAGTVKVAAANLSLGGGRYSSQSQCDLEQAPRKAIIDSLRAAGIATVVASGNSGFRDAISAPACVSSAVSVGNTSKQDTVWPTSNAAPFLNLLAPGGNIMSSVPTDVYDIYTGTSMAAPHVAGAWGILKQKAPAASVDQLVTALTSTGKPVTDTRPGANNLVKPRIQVDAALAVVGVGGLTAAKTCAAASTMPANRFTCTLTVTLTTATPANTVLTVNMSGPGTFVAAPTASSGACVSPPAVALVNSTRYTLTLTRACPAGTVVTVTEQVAVTATGTLTQAVTSSAGGAGAAQASVTYTPPPASGLGATKDCQATDGSGYTCILAVTLFSAVPAGTTFTVGMAGPGTFSGPVTVTAVGCTGPVSITSVSPILYTLRTSFGCAANATVTVTEPVSVSQPAGTLTQTVASSAGGTAVAADSYP